MIRRASAEFTTPPGDVRGGPPLAAGVGEFGAQLGPTPDKFSMTSVGGAGGPGQASEAGTGLTFGRQDGCGRRAHLVGPPWEIGTRGAGTRAIGPSAIHAPNPGAAVLLSHSSPRRTGPRDQRPAFPLDQARYGDRRLVRPALSLPPTPGGEMGRAGGALSSRAELFTGPVQLAGNRVLVVDGSRARFGNDTAVIRF